MDRRQDRPLPRRGHAEAVINWSSFELTADMTPFFARALLVRQAAVGRPRRATGARSPLSLVGNVKTPTMVVVGAEDYRTPNSEVE